MIDKLEFMILTLQLIRNDSKIRKQFIDDLNDDRILPIKTKQKILELVYRQ